VVAIPIVLTLWKLRQEDHEFEANLDCIGRSYLKKKQGCGGSSGRVSGSSKCKTLRSNHSTDKKKKKIIAFLEGITFTNIQTGNFPFVFLEHLLC
jgi:hypothetical protein